MFKKVYLKSISVILIITTTIILIFGNFFLNEQVIDQFKAFKFFTIQQQTILNLISIVAAIIIIFGVTKIKFKKEISFKKGKQIILLLSLIYFVGLIIWNSIFPIMPAFDWETITQIAKLNPEDINSSYLAYLTNYPYQIGTIYYYKFWTTIIPGLGQENFMLLSQVGFAISGIMIYYIALKRLSVRLSLIVAIVYFIFLPFIWYSQVSYTDTLVIPFILAFLLLIFQQNFEITTNPSKIILSFSLIFIASLIKFPALFFPIAIIILLIDHKRIRLAFVFIVLTIIVTFLNNQVINYGTKQYQINKNKSLPTLHWIDMGTSNTKTPGGFDGEIVDRTIENIANSPDATTLQLNQFHINNIIDNHKNRSFSQNLEFYRDKIVYIWSDPYLYANEEPRYNEVVKNATDPLFNSPIIYTITKIFHNLIFLTVLLLGIRSLSKGFNNEQMTLALVFIGMFFFFLFWEARSRYLLMFWPFIISFSTIYLLTQKSQIKKFK
jgi:hypothetical protein